MSNEKDAAAALSPLLQAKLSKNPELAAKQARLLAVLAARQKSAVESKPSPNSLLDQ